MNKSQYGWHLLRIDENGIPALNHDDKRIPIVGQPLTVDGEIEVTTRGLHFGFGPLAAIFQRWQGVDVMKMCYVRMEGVDPLFNSVDGTPTGLMRFGVAHSRTIESWCDAGALITAAAPALTKIAIEDWGGNTRADVQTHYQDALKQLGRASDVYVGLNVRMICLTDGVFELIQCAFRDAGMQKTIKRFYLKRLEDKVIELYQTLKE